SRARQRRPHRRRRRASGGYPHPPADRPLSHARHRQRLRPVEEGVAGLPDSLRAGLGEKGAPELRSLHALRLISAALVFGCAAPSGAAQDDSTRIAASIETAGGSVVRDRTGHIVDVSLARTWATDADVERVAAIKTVRRLELSLPYGSDRGVERLKRLDQREGPKLSAAGFSAAAA